MEEAVVVLLLFSGTIQAILPVQDTDCRATQNVSTCSVSVGASVFIQLMANASGHQLRCKKILPTRSTLVFNLREDRVTIHEEIQDRSQFFISNGTFKLSRVELEDAGQYTVGIFLPDGSHLTTKTVELQVVEEYHLYILIGACAAALLLVVVVVAVCCCVCRRKRRQKNKTQTPHSLWMEDSTS